MRSTALAIFVAALAVLLAACGGEDEEPVPVSTDRSFVSGINPEDFTATIDNPLFPLSSASDLVYEGEETDPDTGETITIRVESTVLSETDIVAGVEVTVVKVDEFEDEELVESTLDYYAQHRDGSVYYLGERVDDYEDGEIVGHHGAWLAGEGENQPGLFMPGNPQAGDEFEQEKAPGVAEDRSTVVAVGQTVTVPAGTFQDCMKTEDFAPLDNVTEFKYYCPGIGLVREEFEDGYLDLVTY